MPSPEEVELDPPNAAFAACQMLERTRRMTSRTPAPSSPAPENIDVVKAASAIITQAAKARLTLRKAKDPRKLQKANDTLAALSAEYARLRPSELPLMQYMEQVYDASVFK